MAVTGGRDRVRSFDRGAWRRGGTAGLAVLLVAALVLMLNYLGWKYHHRADWTGEQLYTLSEKTRGVLDGLDRDVDVVVFLDPLDEAYEPTRELLERYADASPRLAVRFLDPARNPLQARELAERYGVDSAAVVFDDGRDRRVVAAADLLEYDFSGLQAGRRPEVAAFRGEERFTRALVDLAGEGRPRVLFTTGHGEISLDDRTADGLGEAVRILGDDNFELEEWASRGAPEVPEGTDLVVVAGPTATFLPPELALLDRYLEAGGRMLILLDPPLGTASAEIGSTGLEAWLGGYGVAVGDDVVVDPANAYPFYGAETLYADRYPASHPATRSVRQGGLPLLVSLARSVGPVPAADRPGDLDVALLVETSPEGWGETDLAAPARDDADRPGPVPLAVAVEAVATDAVATDPESGDFETGEPAPAAGGSGGGGGNGGGVAAPGSGPAPGLRLVVFGDSTFATDRLLQANVGNAVLLADVLNWMVEREDLLGIPPRRPEQVRLTLTGAQVRWTYLLVLLVLPGLAVLLGVVVHYRRRRR